MQAFQWSLALRSRGGNEHQVQRLCVVERGGRCAQGRLTQLPVGRAGRVKPPARRRQHNPAVALHGQHGHACGHVLESAVGAQPSDAPTELPRQLRAVAGGPLGDRLAQQAYLAGGELAPVIAAHDPIGRYLVKPIGRFSHGREKLWVVESVGAGPVPSTRVARG